MEVAEGQPSPRPRDPQSVYPCGGSVPRSSSAGCVLGLRCWDSRVALASCLLPSQAARDPSMLLGQRLWPRFPDTGTDHLYKGRLSVSPAGPEARWFLRFPWEAETSQINDAPWDADRERIPAFPCSLATESGGIQPGCGPVCNAGATPWGGAGGSQGLQEP